MVAVTSTENSTPGISSRRLLSGSYTLSAGDDGAWFYALSSVTVYVPSGLNPMPTVAFMPPAAGSITLRSLAASVTIAGSTNDYPISIASCPAGLALIPVLGQQDQYAVTASPTFASLPDDPKNNTLLAGYLAGLAAVQGASSQETASRNLTAADHDKVVWIKAQTTDKTLTIPTGLPTNFRCFVAYLNVNAAAGRGKIAASGSTLNWQSQNPISATYVPAVFQNNVSPIFMGVASSNSFAFGIIANEGPAPADTYIISPWCGTWTTT